VPFSAVNVGGALLSRPCDGKTDDVPATNARVLAACAVVVMLALVIGGAHAGPAVVAEASDASPAGVAPPPAAPDGKSDLATAASGGSAPQSTLQTAPRAALETAPAEPELELHYDVYYSLLRLVTIASRSRVVENVYSLQSSMETVGLLGTLFPWTYRSEVHGRIDGERLQPDVFNSHSEIRDRVQQVSLRYDAAGPLVDEITPFDAAVLGQGEDYVRDEVSPEMRAGTIDPLTEIASVSQQLARGQGCAGVRSVFDGLRRYDVIYEDLGETTLEGSRYDAYEGRARQCRSRIKPIAGFWKPKEDEGESITSITAWMMPPVPGADPVPVRIAVEGRRGTLSIHLTKVGAATS